MNHTIRATFKHYLFLTLIITAPFSLVPSVSIERLGYAGLRIGLYIILVGVFVGLYLPELWRVRRKLRTNRYGRLYALGILAVSVLSLTRTLALTRTLLMVMAVDFLVLLTISVRQHVLQTNFMLEKVVRPMLIGGIVYAVFTCIQLAVVTYTNSSALLCVGCGSEVFGFPRANVFAVEPQFWANALLPTFFVALGWAYKYRTKLAIISLFATTLAIGLTFSRGAFFAMAVGAVIFMGLSLYKKDGKVRAFGVPLAILIVGTVASFATLIGSASVRYSGSKDIAYTTTRGMLEHLSLGAIKLPEKTALEVLPIVTSNPESATEPTSTTQNFESQGLVVASQQDRLRPAQMAFRVLGENPANYLFGVGLGNFSPYVQKYIDPKVPLSLTVYIFYVLLLVETGFVGVALFLGAFGVALKRLHSINDFPALVIATILIGFLAQYFFFGSYINVVYIWLWLGIGMGYGVNLTNNNGKHHKKIRSTVSQI